MGSACCREMDPNHRQIFSEVADAAYVCGCGPDGRYQPSAPSASAPSLRPSWGPRCACGPQELFSTGVADWSHRYRGGQLERLLRDLFRLHDLNGNGLLDEQELVQLNSQVAVLHRGKGADLLEVSERYRSLFREKLDPEGRPITYSTFRAYLLKVLDGIDPDPLAQEMIVEQFAVEARSARAAMAMNPSAGASPQASPRASQLPLQLFGSDQDGLAGIAVDEVPDIFRGPPVKPSSKLQVPSERNMAEQAAMGGA